MATVDFLKEMIDTLVQEELSPRLGKTIVRLLEAKIDVEMQRFANDPNMTAFLNTLKENNILPKYIAWLVKVAIRDEVLVNRTPIQSTNIASNWFEKVMRFDKMLQLNQIPLDKRDVNKFEDFNDLLYVVSAAEREYQKKSKTKVAKKSSDKIYEDANFLVIEPKSTEASCVYGKGTQWCISATDSKNYYDEYAERGARFIFIINKQSGDKDAIAFAGNIREIEIYNATDEAKKKNYIEEKYPKHIIGSINNFLGQVTGVQDIFSVVSMDDLMTNPRMAYEDPKMFWNIMKSESRTLLEKSTLLLRVAEVADSQTMNFLHHVIGNISVSIGSIYGRPEKEDLQSVENVYKSLRKLKTVGYKPYPVAEKLVCMYYISALLKEPWTHPNVLYVILEKPDRVKAYIERYNQQVHGQTFGAWNKNTELSEAVNGIAEDFGAHGVQNLNVAKWSLDFWKSLAISVKHNQDFQVGFAKDIFLGLATYLGASGWDVCRLAEALESTPDEEYEYGTSTGRL